MRIPPKAAYTPRVAESVTPATEADPLQPMSSHDAGVREIKKPTRALCNGEHTTNSAEEN
jgi:hypothetical protein